MAAVALGLPRLDVEGPGVPQWVTLHLLPPTADMRPIQAVGWPSNFGGRGSSSYDTRVRVTELDAPSSIAYGPPTQRIALAVYVGELDGHRGGDVGTLLTRALVVVRAWVPDARLLLDLRNSVRLEMRTR